MKSRIRNILAAVMSFVFVQATFARKEKDTVNFIIYGVIYKTHKEMNAKCKLELFKENTLIECSEVKMNKAFERELKRNTWYMIRFTKDGYKPLMISFNTEVGDSAIVLDNLFEFETTLLDDERAMGLNKEQLQFPVGLVAFNKENHKFETNDIYTKNYMAALYKREDLGVENTIAMHK
jgi:hypothetical protein